MTHINKNNNSKPGSKPCSNSLSNSLAKAKHLSVVQDELDNTDNETGMHIDARLLIKRVNSLVAHVSNLDGKEEAEKNSRETSAHIKNIKEIMALNENIERVQAQAQVQEQAKQGYTAEEEIVLAEELATLIIKNGGFS